MQYLDLIGPFENYGCWLYIHPHGRLLFLEMHCPLRLYNSQCRGGHLVPELILCYVPNSGC